MKFFASLLTIILLISLAGLFVLKQPNGQAWLSVDGLLPDAQVINDKIKLASNKIHQVFNSYPAEKDSQIKVYRWKDSNGNWSYSDNPKASIQSEEVLFDQKNIVVLPALDEPIIDLSDSNSKEAHNNVSPSISITAPSKVLELYKDVNNVQKLMDERQQKVSQAIKDNTG